MKKFAILSAILGVMSLGLAAYQHFVVAENAAIAEITIEHDESMCSDEDIMDYYSSQAYRDVRAIYELKTDMGIVTLFVGIAIFLIGIVPIVKKQNLGWIGIIGGLAAIIVGLAYGTHIFS